MHMGMWREREGLAPYRTPDWHCALHHLSRDVTLFLDAWYLRAPWLNWHRGESCGTVALKSHVRYSTVQYAAFTSARAWRGRHCCDRPKLCSLLLCTKNDSYITSQWESKETAAGIIRRISDANDK